METEPRITDITEDDVRDAIAYIKGCRDEALFWWDALQGLREIEQGNYLTYQEFIDQVRERRMGGS